MIVGAGDVGERVYGDEEDGEDDVFWIEGGGDVVGVGIGGIFLCCPGRSVISSSFRGGREGGKGDGDGVDTILSGGCVVDIVSF